MDLMDCMDGGIEEGARRRDARQCGLGCRGVKLRKMPPAGCAGGLVWGGLLFWCYSVFLAVVFYYEVYVFIASAGEVYEDGFIFA